MQTTREDRGLLDSADRSDRGLTWWGCCPPLAPGTPPSVWRSHDAQLCSWCSQTSLAAASLPPVNANWKSARVLEGQSDSPHHHHHSCVALSDAVPRKHHQGDFVATCFLAGIPSAPLLISCAREREGESPFQQSGSAPGLLPESRSSIVGWESTQWST